MITVKQLQDFLLNLPKEAVIFAYEGEDTGISIIDDKTKKSWFIRARNNDKIDHYSSETRSMF